jgi:hypothetical protein
MLAQATIEARIAGVLHDVVEDSDWTLERPRDEGFSEVVLEAIEAVTKRPEEGGDGCEQFVRRAGAHPIGRLVKLADLRDNSDPSRITSPTPEHVARIDKYRRAIELLGG